MNVQQIIDRNREAMRLFEKCINTNDLELGRKLIAETAAFKTPVSPTPLYGAEGYLSVVSLMRKSFPDVQWKLVDMVARYTRTSLRLASRASCKASARFHESHTLCISGGGFLRHQHPSVKSAAAGRGADYHGCASLSWRGHRHCDSLASNRQ